MTAVDDLHEVLAVLGSERATVAVMGFRQAVIAANDSLLNALQPVVSSILQLVQQIQQGRVVPVGTIIVKPAKGGRTWLAWDHDHWAPVHRVADVGWVWSE